MPETAEDAVQRIVAEREGKPKRKRASAKKAQVASKRKPGRPLKEPRVTEDVITELASIGCTNEELVILTGLSEDTLERRFAEVIEKGRATMRMSVRRQQLATANDRHDPAHGTMLVWLGKVLLEQKDTSRMEVTGADGGPIVHADLATKTDADLIAEAEAIARGAAATRSDPK